MKSPAQKLGFKAEHTCLIIDLPSRNLLGDLPPLVAEDSQPRLSDYDAIIIFTTSRADLAAKLDGALGRYKKGGLLWIAYPKLSSKLAGDLNRNWLMTAINGFEPVTNVAIDEDWTALRFRPHEEVGT
jgi:hypothetical protein